MPKNNPPQLSTQAAGLADSIDKIVRALLSGSRSCSGTIKFELEPGAPFRLAIFSDQEPAGKIER